MSKTIYYVYAYLRSKDSQTAPAGTPYYVGYGKGHRAYNKHRIPVPKDKSKIVFLHHNLYEEQAKDLEIREISKYGRKDLGTGILTNLTHGGEGVSGMKFSDKTRKLWSSQRSGENGYFYGKRHTEETKRNLSKAMKGRKGHGKGNKGKFGKDHPAYGHTVSDKTCDNVKYMTEHNRQYGPWNKDKKLKPLSKEHKEKISNSLKKNKKNKIPKYNFINIETNIIEYDISALDMSIKYKLTPQFLRMLGRREKTVYKYWRLYNE